MDIERRFACIAHMESAAQRRIPRFAWDYMAGGIGRERMLAENIARLDRVKLRPRYLVDDADAPDTAHRLFGVDYPLPFGVAPIGLSGLIWPAAAEHLARAAKDSGIPFALSGVATSSIEQIGAIGGHLWYQHYATNDTAINSDLLERAHRAGFEVLVVTVDIPTATRRDRDIRNGLSVPPELDLRTLGDILARPAWALAMLRQGMPEFLNLKPYLPARLSLSELGVHLSELIEGHVSIDKLRWYRQQWPGKLIVKGILDATDARVCVDIGADAIVVSNHGGRQLDAAQTAVDALPSIRTAVGDDFPLLADGGIRNGLDIARYLALGADFALLGRAFMFALGAIGSGGGVHAMSVLQAELRSTLGQLGCSEIRRLPEFLIREE
ncbi:MAG: alpha-hydroxy-acid oxidizing protein [Gammaproteobacteria bacterium]|nr:alpha-hydroxy-acid oxidizing protein [Gammaproteobacteria bacterium]